MFEGLNAIHAIDAAFSQRHFIFNLNSSPPFLHLCSTFLFLSWQMRLNDSFNGLKGKGGIDWQERGEERERKKNDRDDTQWSEGRAISYSIHDTS